MSRGNHPRFRILNFYINEHKCDLFSTSQNTLILVYKGQGDSYRGTEPKSKIDQYRPEIEALLANGSTQKFIATRYKTTEANLHNWIKKNNIKRS